MNNSVFKNVLQDNEKILFEAGVNKKAYLLKTNLSVLIWIILAPIVFTFVINNFAVNTLGSNTVTTTLSTIFLLFFIFPFILAFFGSILDAKNTYFAITDTRIIKRTGAFNIRYIHYSLKNIGNVSINESVYDSKGENGSATLTIIAKDFQSDVESLITITSLNKGYTAYKILTEKIKGNNEVFRIKTQN